MVRTMQLEVLSKMNNGHEPLAAALSPYHSYRELHSPNIDLRVFKLYKKIMTL